MEFLLNTNTSDLHVTMKADRNELAESFVNYFTFVLRPILLS